jgi:hypothetical protein
LESSAKESGRPEAWRSASGIDAHTAADKRRWLNVGDGASTAECTSLRYDFGIVLPLCCPKGCPTEGPCIREQKINRRDRGIDALIVADDVPPPVQLTEGVELRVLEGVANRARRVLEEETTVSVEEGSGTGMPPESPQQERGVSLTFGSGGLVQATA